MIVIVPIVAAAMIVIDTVHDHLLQEDMHHVVSTQGMSWVTAACACACA